MASRGTDIILISSDDSEGPIVISSDSDEEIVVEIPKPVFSNVTTTTRSGVRNDAKSFFEKNVDENGRCYKSSPTEILLNFKRDIELARLKGLEEKEDSQNVPDVSSKTKSNAKANGPRNRDRRRLSLSKLKDKKTWSQYKAEKEKSRWNVTRVSASPTSMGCEASDKEGVASTAKVHSVVMDKVHTCMQHSTEENMQPAKADGENLPVSKGNIDLSPEYARHSSSCSTCTSSSSPQLLSNRSSPLVETSPRNTAKGFAFCDWHRPKKKLNFGKVELPLDDELSDSLPDLEEIFPLTDMPEKENFNTPPVLQAYNVQKEISPQKRTVRNLEMPYDEADPEMPNLIDSCHSLLSDSSPLARKFTIDTSNGRLLTLKDKLSSILSKNKTKEVSVKIDKDSKSSSDIITQEAETGSEYNSSTDHRHYLDFLGYSPAKKMKLVSEDGTVYSKGVDTGCCMPRDSSHCSDVVRILSDHDVDNNLEKSSAESGNCTILKNLDNVHQNNEALVASALSSSSQGSKTAKLELPQSKVSPYSDVVKRVCSAAASAPRKFLEEMRSMGHKSEDEFVAKQLDWDQLPLKETVEEFAQKNCKILFPSLVTDFGLSDEMIEVADHRVQFSATQVNAIEAAMEEGACFMSHVVDLAQAFTLDYMPPTSVVSHIYQVGLLQSTSMNQSLRAFNCLSFIQRKFPGSIKVDWKMLSNIMENLGLTKAALTADQCCLLNCSLALQLIIQEFRGELRAMDLSDPVRIRRSQAYKVLSGDHELNHLKQLTDWINRVVTTGEYKEVCESYINLQLEGDNRPTADWHWPAGIWVEEVKPVPEESRRVLPLLQQLFEIAILVSTSNVDCARRFAEDFVRIFFYLPTLEHKKLLLQTMSSDLLRFKLCQLFLEAHCDVAQCCTDFPPTLQDVIECLFKATPPRSQLTPPMTPSDDDDLEDLPISAKVSPESCEQLCMLQYYALHSYLKCVKSQCNKALRRRGSREGVQYRISEIDRKTLQNNLESSVESLRRRLMELSGGTTPFTEHYLMMMACLA